MSPPAAPAAAFRVTVRLNQEDLALAGIFDLGTLGTEARPGAAPDQILLLAYFADRPGLETELRQALSSLAGVEVERTQVAEVDWVARFYEGFQPFVAGGFWITPPWNVPQPPAGLRSLLVDPGRAFGTGTHETTRLCLAVLESMAAAGPLGRVLDVGTGSGILAVAARLLGATVVVAIDDDPEATASARRHARLNRVDFGLVLGDGGAPFHERAFDLVLANIQAPVLLAKRDQLLSLCAVGGRLVLSGLLQDDLAAIRASYGAVGTLGVSTDGEWVAVMVEPTRSPVG